MEDFGQTIRLISVMALPVIFAVVLHEIAHGYVAYIKGDDTAKKMGRLTLNPIAHMDWFGTVILPFMFFAVTGFLFAFAKPVPVSFEKLKNPKKDMAIVAAAGPITNVILAIISAMIFKLIGYINPEAMMIFSNSLIEKNVSFSGYFMIPILFMLYFSIILNIVLAVINMIPIPPADGGRVLTGLLPDEQSAKYAEIEEYGMYILVAILIINPFSILDYTIRPMIELLVGLLI